MLQTRCPALLCQPIIGTESSCCRTHNLYLPPQAKAVPTRPGKVPLEKGYSQLDWMRVSRTEDTSGAMPAFHLSFMNHAYSRATTERTQQLFANDNLVAGMLSCYHVGLDSYIRAAKGRMTSSRGLCGYGLWLAYKWYARARCLLSCNCRQKRRSSQTGHNARGSAAA